MTAPALVVIGTSLGGLHALQSVLGGLGATFPWPVAIVQHRSAEDIDDTLAVILQRHCVLPVREVEDKDPIEPGRVYLGPSDYHLLVEADGFALSTEGRVTFARPSIDVLFESAAAVFGRMVVAVVLTGASSDGAAGVVSVKAAGGRVLVQDPLTADSAVMPRAAIATRRVDEILPLATIGSRLNQLVQQRH